MSMTTEFKQRARKTLCPGKASRADRPAPKPAQPARPVGPPAAPGPDKPGLRLSRMSLDIQLEGLARWLDGQQRAHDAAATRPEGERFAAWHKGKAREIGAWVEMLGEVRKRLARGG